MRKERIMLEISSSVERQLPSTVKTALSKLSTEKQSLFEEEFKKKAKSTTTAYICLIFLIFSVHYFYLGKPGRNILFWFTWGGLGIWWLIDLVTLGKRVSEYNEDVAKAILRDMKLMDS